MPCLPIGDLMPSPSPPPPPPATSDFTSFFQATQLRALPLTHHQLLLVWSDARVGSKCVSELLFL